MEVRTMPDTKGSDRRKGRIKAVPVLRAAGLSLSLASGASAAIGSANLAHAASSPAAWQVMSEEEITDVSLASFHLFDNGDVGPRRQRTRPIRIGQGACGADLYYPQSPPAGGASAYQAPPTSRATRPAYRYKRPR